MRLYNGNPYTIIIPKNRKIKIHFIYCFTIMIYWKKLKKQAFNLLETLF